MVLSSQGLVMTGHYQVLGFPFADVKRSVRLFP